MNYELKEGEQIVQAKPRKHMELYQYYQLWDDITRIAVKYKNRIGAVERGDSAKSIDIYDEALHGHEYNTDPKLADQALTYRNPATGRINKMNTGVTGMQKWYVDLMAAKCEDIPIYHYLMEYRGIDRASASRLIALVDDIALFDTVAKFWRYCGHGVYQYWVDKNEKRMAPKDGYRSERRGTRPDDYTVRWFEVAEPSEDWALKWKSDKLIAGSGWCSPYNKELKSHLYVMGTGFINHRTPVLRDVYDYEKERYLQTGRFGTREEPGHAHNAAMRKMRKHFLKEVWLEWRRLEGLPITEPHEAMNQI